MTNHDEQADADQSREIEAAEKALLADPQLRAILILLHALGRRMQAPIGLVAVDVHRIGMLYRDEDKDLGNCCLALAAILDSWVPTPPIAEAKEARRLRLERENDERLLKPLKED